MPNNEFHGSIPKEIGSMKKLRELVLSDNNLTGSIPTEINEVTTLERLALMSQNGPEPIKGRLPDFATAPNLWYCNTWHTSYRFVIRDFATLNY